MFLEVGRTGWFGSYNWKCQPVVYLDDVITRRALNVSWLYFINKIFDFFDTFFFILRKKNNQISLLHIVHHTIMPFSVWWGLKFVPIGHSTLFGLINSFVHVLMYFYYTIAALGPAMQKFLWWKKYLTIFQIVQFLTIFLHAFQLFFNNSCGFPIVFAFVIAGHGILFIFLFTKYLFNQ
jgi:hypothetical protein